MAENTLIDSAIIQGWADTIREKTGTTDKMLPTELLAATQDLKGGFDSSDANLKYFVYQLDTTNKQIIIYDILVDVLAAENAISINIPDTLGGYDVVIKTNAYV